MSTYFRIHQADRDAADLLDPANHVSYNWNDAADERDCPACDGRGFDIDGDCAECDGEGRVENVRIGVSACDSIENLYAYIRTSGAFVDDTVIVEMIGHRSDDQAEDATIGEHLIHPTDIVSVTPVTEDTITAIHQED